MSAKTPPTVVLNEVSYNGGETGYRVILSEGADIFGETGEHVAETIAESDADLEDAVRMCKLHLQGWDAIEGADLEWLWDHRPDRVGKSSYHLSQAILEDVRAPLPSTETVTSGDSDLDRIVDYTPSTDDEGGKSITHPDSSEISAHDSDIPESVTELRKKLHSSVQAAIVLQSHISAYGEKSTHIREDSDESIRIEQDDCGHLPEYQINGECLRCDLERQGEQDRAVKRELTADAGGGV